MREKSNSYLSVNYLLVLSLVLAFLSGCSNDNGEKAKTPDQKGLPSSPSSWEGVMGIEGCDPSKLLIDHIPSEQLIVVLHADQDSKGNLYLIRPGAGLLDSVSLGSEHDLSTIQMATWGKHVCIASDTAIGIQEFTQNGWGDYKSLDCPSEFEVTAFNTDAVTIKVSSDNNIGRYLFAPSGEKLYWEDFTINADILSVKRNSQGRWAVGSYNELLIANGDTIFPKPREKQMAYLAFAGNYQGNDWGRQIGGTVPGKPRDWQESWPLDLQVDPAGYGWVLWQGNLADRSANATVLGVNFYDPSGILLKNLVFQAPGRSRISRSLQLMSNSQLCIHSTYTPEDIAEQNRGQGADPMQEWLPVQSVLVFDRQGNVTLDRSLVMKKGQKVRSAHIQDGKLLLTGVLDSNADPNSAGQGCVIFHDTYDLK